MLTQHCMLNFISSFKIGTPGDFHWSSETWISGLLTKSRAQCESWVTSIPMRALHIIWMIHMIRYIFQWSDGQPILFQVLFPMYFKFCRFYIIIQGISFSWNIVSYDFGTNSLSLTLVLNSEKVREWDQSTKMGRLVNFGGENTIWILCVCVHIET